MGHVHRPARCHQDSRRHRRAWNVELDPIRRPGGRVGPQGEPSREEATEEHQLRRQPDDDPNPERCRTSVGRTRVGRGHGRHSRVCIRGSRVSAGNATTQLAYSAVRAFARHCRCAARMAARPRSPAGDRDGCRGIRDGCETPRSPREKLAWGTQRGVRGRRGGRDRCHSVRHRSLRHQPPQRAHAPAPAARPGRTAGVRSVGTGHLAPAGGPSTEPRSGRPDAAEPGDTCAAASSDGMAPVRWGHRVALHDLVARRRRAQRCRPRRPARAPRADRDRCSCCRWSVPTFSPTQCHTRCGSSPSSRRSRSTPSSRWHCSLHEHRSHPRHTRRWTSSEPRPGSSGEPVSS